MKKIIECILGLASAVWLLLLATCWLAFGYSIWSMFDDSSRGIGMFAGSIVAYVAIRVVGKWAIKGIYAAYKAT